MKGLDTNILVRYFVQDDPIQGHKVSEFIETIVAEGETCFINNIVLCELIWVLESAYGYSKQEIAELLDKVLRTSIFQFENKDILWRSLQQYKNSKADFSDCLIGEQNRIYGCDETVSFDKGVKGVEGFKIL